MDSRIRSLPTLTRTATIELVPSVRDAAGKELTAPVFRLSLSSEASVERSFWGERYVEILDHSPNAVDMAYSRGGLPLLLNHNPERQIGLATGITVTSDKRLIAEDIRWSSSPEAQQIRQDVIDGIRSNMSVGYRVRDAEVVAPEKDGEPITIFARQWTPLEGSIVPVPADISVGIGRADDAEQPVLVRTLSRSKAMETPTPTPAPEPTPAPAAANGNVAVVRNETDERYRQLSDIAQLSHRTSDLPRWINELRSGRAIEDIRKEVLDDAARSVKAVDTPAVVLNDRERKAYSITRAINAMVDSMGPERGTRGQRLAGFEVDVSQQIHENMRNVQGYEPKGGLLIPLLTKKRDYDEEMWTRAGLDSATSTKGSELKFNVPGDFLPLLRNLQVCALAGAQTMTGLRGPVRFPNQNAAATATWSAENPGSDVSDSNLTLQQIALDPKTLLASTSYSRQLLAQAVIDVESMVRQDLALVNAIALDLGALAGTGASNQPTGVISTSGIGSVTTGANGGTVTYLNLVNLETLVAQANADQLGNLGYVTSPKMRGQFKGIVPLSNTIGLPVWTPAGTQPIGDAQIQGASSRIPGQVNGYPAWASQQSPDNLTKGTATTICSAVTFGAWSALTIGDWGMFEIIVDPYRLKKQGMIEVTSFMMAGVAVRYAGAFACIKDAL